MKFTSRLVFIFFVVFVTAFCIRQMLQIISTDFDVKFSNDKYDDAHTFLTDTEENLIWFVQISDLHVSVFQDPGRIAEFRKFCDSTIKILQPRVVLATGDLTDAKAVEGVGSKQMVEEWSIYHNILTESGILHTTTWLDIRGNHDNFNVPGVRSPMNLFRKFSSQGPKHEGSYLHVEQVGTQYYSFIALDACPNQGLKRPFNFIGYVPPEELSHVTQLLEKATQKSNYTIWFGHYPTSAIFNGPAIRKIIGSKKHSNVYLCGHYHSLLNLVPQMYTLQKQYYLELELEDWKRNRMFRLAAIDHGVFSFVDIKHSEWPVILVLQPKHGLFQLRSKEPFFLTQHSFVRILAFSTDDIVSVQIKIDDGKWETCKPHPKNKHLFRKSWNSKQYSAGAHTLHVKAVDQQNRERSISQPFSFDHTKFDFNVLPRIVLMTNLSSVLQLFFGTSVLMVVLPLCIFRVLGSWKRECLVSLINGPGGDWIRRFSLLVNSPTSFYLLITYPLYMAFAPWAVGEVIDGHWGVMFIWGTFVNNQFIPELSTYGYGFVQMAFFQLPLLVITAYAFDRKRLQRGSTSLPFLSKVVDLSVFHLPYISLLVSQLWMTYSFWQAFGLTALAIGPVRVFPVLLITILWYRLHTEG